MRDPRRDPERGDVVYKGTLSRKVEDIIGFEIRYTSQVGKRSSCWLTTWRNWCRGATLEPIPAATSEDQGLRIRYVELENRVHNAEQLLVATEDRVLRLELLIGSGAGIGIEGL